MAVAQHGSPAAHAVTRSTTPHAASTQNTVSSSSIYQMRRLRKCTGCSRTRHPNRFLVTTTAVWLAGHLQVGYTIAAVAARDARAVQRQVSAIAEPLLLLHPNLCCSLLLALLLRLLLDLKKLATQQSAEAHPQQQQHLCSCCKTAKIQHVVSFSTKSPASAAARIPCSI